MHDAREGFRDAQDQFQINTSEPINDIYNVQEVEGINYEDVMREELRNYLGSTDKRIDSSERQ